MNLQDNPKTNTSNSSNSSAASIIVPMSILLVVAMGAAGYFGYQYFNAENQLSVESFNDANPEQAAAEEVARIEGLIADNIVIPEGEPAIATILEVEKLKEDNADFYKNAQNGDKLIVYPTVAIVYNEENDVIVNMTPILQPPTAEVASEATSEPADTEVSE